jgi:hypothetical protein
MATEKHTAADTKAPYASSEEMEVYGREAFDTVMRPSDCYTPHGRYWADLPFGQQLRFVTTLDGNEAWSEFACLWNMFKNDPLAPLGYYFKNAVLPGAGLGLEG